MTSDDILMSRSFRMYAYHSDIPMCTTVGEVGPTLLSQRRSVAAVWCTSTGNTRGLRPTQQWRNQLPMYFPQVLADFWLAPAPGCNRAIEPIPFVHVCGMRRNLPVPLRTCACVCCTSGFRLIPTAASYIILIVDINTVVVTAL